jgi:hypothetical protein
MTNSTFISTVKLKGGHVKLKNGQLVQTFGQIGDLLIEPQKMTRWNRKRSPSKRKSIV